jgi:hypothetical protein
MGLDVGLGKSNKSAPEQRLQYADLRFWLADVTRTLGQ